MKLNSTALATSGAIIAGFAMIFLSVASTFGIYEQATNQMKKWHMFYDVTVWGTITGIIEAGVITFITLYLFAIIYNSLVKK